MGRQELAVGTTRRQGGFLYIEVLIGLAILSLALLALLPMFVLASRSGAVAGDVTLAAALAQDKAEELRYASFASLTTGSFSQVVMKRRVRYRCTWQVEVNAPQPGMKRVTVSVQPLRLDPMMGRGVTQVSFYRAQ